MHNEIRDNWTIRQEKYEPDREDFHESIFCLGNGYMGVSGFSEERQGRKSYELYTFIAGIFDYIKPGITDMVNTPNFLYTRILLDGELFDYGGGTVLGFQRSLDMRDGALTKTVLWQDGRGRITKVESVRFLSIDSIHNAAVRYRITPVNYSGKVVFETAIDARVSNNPISDDQMRNDVDPVEILHDMEKGATGDGICFIRTATGETGYGISEAFTVEPVRSKGKTEFRDACREEDRYVSRIIEFDACQGEEYVFDKFIAVYTSRDGLEADAGIAAANSAAAARKTGFESLLSANRAAWARKWEVADIVIEGDDKAQLGIRYNIFQLIQGNAENDPKVSIGARSIFHGRYKGCYFWDTEIFMFPFFAYTDPKAARNLLMYRYHTLPGAEENARRQNAEGARYAWMCSIDGMEQCETWDTGCCEVHITADVAYAVNQYCDITGDEEFLRAYAAEIYIKTARFWKSRFTYDRQTDRYNMLFVKGPDEYCGVTENNTYTTKMAVNNFRLAMEAIALLKSEYGDDWNRLKAKIGFGESEQDEWREISEKAAINYDAQRNLYMEDDNFLKLEPLDIEKYKTDDTPLYHKISFDRLQRYRVLKQADVVLLMSLLPEDFTPEEQRAAWDFYEPITLHDSTLSFGTHALFAARLGLMEKAYEYFDKSLYLDLEDIMRNTGREGVHFASFGATWQALVNGFGGVRLKDGGIAVTPNMPAGWTSLRFKFYYKGELIGVTVTKTDVKATVNGKDLSVKFYSDRRSGFYLDMTGPKENGQPEGIETGEEVGVNKRSDPSDAFSEKKL